MTDFQRTERERAFVRVWEHLKNAHSLIRAAAHMNEMFNLGLGELAELDRKLVHELNVCARVHKQPPETHS